MAVVTASDTVEAIIDRYLADYPGATISTIYDFQRKEFSEESHDIPVQEVIYR